ncbi:ryanodine receptor-like isoform X4 [Pomacea canaliculata]|uniref:ryanodine receptor-like isoform X4 n=1 Tax=Pomacea canaliculata TaxID=400727 RepID=UPI000D736DB4|nr:ryanodine receptor-like isoform X4 [Pomacea canaliculata]
MADPAEGGGSEQDDVSFLRTDDMVCLSCLSPLASKDSNATDRVCLSAEGFGNRMCSLEGISNKDVPPDISVCVFVLEQALSVRALQEMVTSTSQASTAAQSGHRTLLYGHAVLLRHYHGNMYLSCLSTSSSNDKLAFDVGLQETAEGESCWWTIHPASKQRSEGEKVRVGDDLILVSVSSERYLHIGSGNSVLASFQQTLWTVVPICSGAVRQKTLGYVFGGDVLRLFHGHMDECLALPEAGSENEFNCVMYETGAVCSHARSLWRLEHTRTKWAGGFMGWGQQCRIRHVTSGRYLSVTPDNQVVTVHRNHADEKSTVFCLVQSKDEKKQGEMREDEGMGHPDLKYGDSMVFIQHRDTGLWLSYVTFETKKRGIGRVEEKKAIMMVEGHMDDGFTFSRAQEEESRSARVIRKCQSLFNRALDALKTDGRTSYAWSRISLSEVIKCLEDLIDYFAQPAQGVEHEEKQNRLRALRNRQDLFQEEGMIALILETIDKFSQYKSRRQFAHYAGEDAAGKWDDISSYLYLLLAAMIRGNRANCAQFAQSYRLDWLVNRLESQQSSKGVLDVLHCVLIDSPEALNMIKEKHIITIISLIDKHGRDPKVLDVLRSLCVGNGVAVRTNQNLICDNLLPGRDLLLQTKLVDHVTSLRPNIYVGLLEGSAMYKKWYFEVVIINYQAASHLPPVLRMGWASTAGFIPYPGGGEHWGANGAGEDLYSYAFDGLHLWTGGKSKQVRRASIALQKGDVIGCALDLTVPQIMFTVNGVKVCGFFKDFNTDGMFFPVITMSANVSCRYVFGGDHGRLKFGPPDEHSPVIESLPPKEKMRIEPCYYFGELNKNIISGPTEICDYHPFVPNPVSTSHIQLPAFIENVRDKLAENLHELWAVAKVDQGWSYGETRDVQHKKNPSLTSFERLPVTEKKYVITVAFETLRTLLALGYHITVNIQQQQNNRLKMLKLGNNYLQSNGYKPSPLDLSGITLSEKLEELVELLAENTHNVWARDRIKNGWTYGLYEDPVHKRSPHLVPYNKVDEHIKVANRDTSKEAVRTLIAYGYTIEAPTSETGESGMTELRRQKWDWDSLTKETADKARRSRTYRAEKTYAVTSGKWYYEVEVLTTGDMHVGWARISADPSAQLGSEPNSYGFDGYMARKWHMGNHEAFGKQWQKGDVIGCMLDLHDNTISFSLNGELMMDSLGQEIAFRNVQTEDGIGFVPAFTLGALQQAKVNFGQDVNTLKYFTCCGLQEGYEPFCVNMVRPLTLWYGKEQPLFETVTASHPELSIARIQGGNNAGPCLKVSSKTFGTLEKVHLEYLRLSLPVKCKDVFTTSKDKQLAQAVLEKRLNLENLRRREMDVEEEASAGGHESRVETSRHLSNANQTANTVRALVQHAFKLTSDVTRLVTQENGLSFEHDSPPHNMIENRIEETIPEANEEDLSVSTGDLVNGGPDLTLRKTTHHSFMDDEQLTASDRRKTYQKNIKSGKGHSLDDASVASHSTGGLKAAASESQLNETDSFLSPPKEKRTSSKLSLLADKMLDTAKNIAEKQNKKTKSSFPTIFRKTKSRDPSPNSTGRARSTEYSSLDRKNVSARTGHLDRKKKSPTKSSTIPPVRVTGLDGEDSADVDLDKDLIPYEFQDAMEQRPGFSQFSEDSDFGHSDAELNELNAIAEQIEEYSYFVRIFPGQDPAHVWVGWVTPSFHFMDKSFDTKKVRHVVLSTLDMDYKMKASVSRKNCYIMSAGDLQQRYADANQEMSSKRSSPGLVIGCFIDTATGTLSFTVNGKEVANKFQMEPGSKLYPTVICEPTSKEMFQFELGSTRTTLPLSAAVFRGLKTLMPNCPPRLDVQVLKRSHWSRVPNTCVQVSTLKLSDIRGWSMICEDPVGMLAVHIPDEDRCLDILELTEHSNLLDFHAKTLELYQAVCSHGNHRVANALTKHVDELQLMYCIKSEFMPGKLRMGFHDLLIAMHLDSHTRARVMTQNEYIIPLTNTTRTLSLYRRLSPASDTHSIKHQIPNMEDSVSIRPQLAITEKQIEDRVQKNGPESTAPYFPVDQLKSFVMESLTTAMEKGAAHIRDPIGGSNANLFVPLVKVCDNLLVMGLLNDEDVYHLLCLLDPSVFDPDHSNNPSGLGLLNMVLDEPVKLEVCRVLQHLCDFQLRHRVESIVAFSDTFVANSQNDQLRRYNEIKQADLPSAITAKKTKEFRCPPHEQMRKLLMFRSGNEDDTDECPCREDIRESLRSFHSSLLVHCKMPEMIEEETQPESVELPKPSLRERLMALVGYAKQLEKKTSDGTKSRPDTMQKLITSTMVHWAEETFITSQELVREMFSLLHRQYDGIGELMTALEKTYVISVNSREDINQLLKALGIIRSLLQVQAGRDEEELMKGSLKDLMDNKVFFQHPDLMRALCVHETVMQLMVNTLNKAQLQQQATTGSAPAEASTATGRQAPNSSIDALNEQSKQAICKFRKRCWDAAAEMVVMCCRFLCYFCRTSRQNQRAMFEHLSYLLENSSMLLARPSLRGSCPLDVACSSLMDNNELALALRESHLEKVAIYLSRCGLQSNGELIEKGYPDLGWDPVEGERFLDFLRFCVWVNGENVEENANLVVRLLIRRPECLGPALRGEGGGLLKAMKDGVRMSKQIAASRDETSSSFLNAMTDDDTGGNYLVQSKYNFNTLPSEDDEDYIDMGAAILDFYSSLVDLLGKCAPDAETIKSGRSDSLRARAILRSLVSMEDLEGVLALQFILPVNTSSEEGEGGLGGGDMPPGLLPNHKASIVTFLDRVYGIEDQITFYRLIDEAFLPDLRAATTLDMAAASESDMALALNRYLCTSVLPLLMKHSEFFRESEHMSSLLETMLQTVYRMSKCKTLTKGQQETVSDFLVAFTQQLRPPMMTNLLRKLTVDVPALSEHAVIPLRVLTSHYERCGRYYGSGGGYQGSASEEEKRLTMMLFSGIFDSLAQRAYDPELFSKALPCLSAIGCALSPDYSLSHHDDSWLRQTSMDLDGAFNPRPVDTSRVNLNQHLESASTKFAEHFHDCWAMKEIEEGWLFGTNYDDDRKTHPLLKPYHLLDEKTKRRYTDPVRDSLKAMLAWGWTLEQDQARFTSNRDSVKRRASKANIHEHGYSPRPYDLRNITLTREMLTMAERLAENSHDLWAKRKREELDSIGGGVHPQLVPYDILTDRERRKNREHAQELLRFLQFLGFRISSGDMGLERRRESASRGSRESEADSGVGVSATERRFAYSLLEKLLEYLDNASVNMQQMRPSSRFSRRESYSTATEDVKFFGKVVLPFVEKYFHAHRVYFIASPNSPQSSSGMASIKEKEMAASLFCKLAQTLRMKITAFGHDVNISVRCLRMLVQAVDFRSVVKNGPEMVRSSLLPFFNNAADDLTQVVENLRKEKFSHVKGTICRGATSLNYVHMVLLPVLSSLYDHFGHNHFGSDLIVGDIQLACYRILNALYTLGTSSSAFSHRDTIASELARHRPALGECVGSFASCFPVAFLEPDLNKYNRHSILFGLEGKISEHSLEAQEVMDQLKENLPGLDKIVSEIEELAHSGGKYHEAPHVIEVTLPMICSYLPYWLAYGPDGHQRQEGTNLVTRVTAKQMNSVLGNVLKLILNNIGSEDAPWMNRIATRTQPIIANSTPDMIKDHFLPIAHKLRDSALVVEQLEKRLAHQKRISSEGSEDLEQYVQEKFSTLVRDIYAFYPLLIKYVDLHRSHWLKNPAPEAEELFSCVADIFTMWTKSLFFKREEQNFVSHNEIDNMALIMPSQASRLSIGKVSESQESTASKRTGGRRREKKRLEPHNSLNVACLKRLVPVGLGFFSGREQELLQQAKQKLLQKDPEGDIKEFLLQSLTTEEGPIDDKVRWQKVLYRKIGDSKMPGNSQLAQQRIIERIISMAKVMHGLHMVEHPSSALKNAWKKVISSQRKRAVMACFRMIPLYGTPRHRAINLFLKSYKEQWLDTEERDKNILIVDLTEAHGGERETEEKKDVEEEAKPDPLKQLITALSRGATKELQSSLPEDPLYISYAEIMGLSCSGEDEDDDDDDGGEDEGPGPTFEEQEMEKQQLLFEQARLADRGAAEMVLLYISASRGEPGEMVTETINLGISLLRGGNTDVQKKMLQHLKDKKDVGFFTSVSGLMQQCSVLDLDAFERTNKAEGLGMISEPGAGAGEKNMHDAEFTCKLFRFLQLLCEGHNLEFQNYLRTQAGNTTTVNIIICTVDYLLRLQESIMDFYWHYSGKDIIDKAGKDNFCRAIMVAKQVFCTLTEYIQGPCSLNQLALAHSRLWDAVGGFLYIFANMQDKLSKDPDQLDLLREFMRLQKEMMIMLLSMLEGNVMNGPIGKQMVDTLMESSANVEMILKFFDIFLKMKDLTTSEAFLEFDTNKDGWISHKEFRRAMESQKIYSEEEIEYIMMCVDANHDGKVDFTEFTDRFHNPAKDIGFTMAVLLTNLWEHMPNEPRLERLLEKAKSVLDYFGPFLGRIEILGSAHRIERVYFEIKQSHIDQWEKPQIKESKRSFLHSVVNEGGDKEKLESFVNFCEETIFEMQHATSISAEEQRIAAMRSGAGMHGEGREEERQPTRGSVLEPLTLVYRVLRDSLAGLFSMFTWSNLKKCYYSYRSMTYPQLVLTFFKLAFRLMLFMGTVFFRVLWTLLKFFINMMMGDRSLEETKAEPVSKGPIALPVGPLALAQAQAANGTSMVPPAELDMSPLVIGSVPPADTQDNSKLKESSPVQNGVQFCGTTEQPGTPATPVNASPQQLFSRQTSEIDDEVFMAEPSTPVMATPSKNGQTAFTSDFRSPEVTQEPAGSKLEDEAPIDQQSFDYGKYILSLFARNFYNFKYLALTLAFFINVILLFYKVSKVSGDLDDDAAAATFNGTAEEEEDDGSNEIVVIEDDFYYLEPVMRVLALLHSLTAFSMLVAYYCLKVPLVIFKREKELARKLEFEGLYIVEQPGDDDVKAHWDKLVLSTQSFPESYWDKFIKKKVRARYSEQYDFEAITNLLGMGKPTTKVESTPSKSRFIPSFLCNVDYQYQIWKWGVIFTDNSFLYIAWYFLFSVLGNFNYFFFAAHLLDVAIGFKTLRTILQSVTHNGKQLVLTVMLTCVVVYIYTVVAFNFFRKFYVKEEDGQVDYKCHDMATCFVYHLHTGVRAGGGIGDEIEPADGDNYEAYRILFDITFFFFVIVILLAIIQGLIIDAFGELRDQLEQVKEDMESKCFICGIGKEYFDKVPHGFEKHVMNEHNFANYMFFIMHLINKPETEYTGQETYVYKLYSQRCWDFFPVGDCFIKQHETEPSG